MRRIVRDVLVLCFSLCLGAASPSPAVAAEVGENDFRISVSGPEGDTSFFAGLSAVAYNPVDDEYLVVWAGTDDADPALGANELEIIGQRIEAATGALIGAALRVSDMGPDGLSSFSAIMPDVVYNAAHHEYLVIWVGDDGTPPLVDDEFEVFGQRLDAATGAEVGANDFRISNMGADGDPFYGFGISPFFGVFDIAPAVAYDATDDQYLVVWAGDDDTAPLVDDELEVFGQRLSGADGSSLGDDFRISHAGVDGDTGFSARTPDVAYNAVDNEYLVVWQGNGFVPNDIFDKTFEIVGQRLDAATGDALDPGPIRISDMGPMFDLDFRASAPAVAHNPGDNEYLVVWQGDDDTEPLVVGEQEIFGQRLNAATGEHVGPNDFRISAMGPDGSGSFDAFAPALSYNPADQEYLVVWVGDDDGASLVDDEFEVYARRLDAATGEGLGEQTRISDVGLDGFAPFGAGEAAVAYGAARNEYLVVWTADETVDSELEIYGQLLADPTCGNGTVEDEEECDDGNADDGDGCSAACLSEDGGTTAGTDDSGGGCNLISRES